MYWISNVRRRATTVAAGVSEWRSRRLIRAGGRPPLVAHARFRRLQVHEERSSLPLNGPVLPPATGSRFITLTAARQRADKPGTSQPTLIAQRNLRPSSSSSIAPTMRLSILPPSGPSRACKNKRICAPAAGR
jgi:hypothetical protein